MPQPFRAKRSTKHLKKSLSDRTFSSSHASEDKEAIAKPLADALKARGLAVWYDDFSLKLGDSLRQSVDRCLARSRFGVVILSPHFFEKHWPAQELNGLATREVDGKKVILPVWHNVGFKEVREYSPMLADKVAVSTGKGLEYVVRKIVDAVAVSFTAVAQTSAQEEMIFEESVYWKRKDGGPRDGPYCPVCYEDKHKTIHLSPGATKGTYSCGVCKNTFTTKEYDPRPVRRRGFSRR